MRETLNEEVVDRIYEKELKSVNLPIRKFATGASRNTDEGKLKYEGFVNPAVLRRYAQYMNKHRFLQDGTLREPDNWQNGIDREVYIDSLVRHVVDAWLVERGYEPSDKVDYEDILCAIIFNGMGLLFEVMGLRKGQENG